MFNTKCGCPDCKGQPVPTSRSGWKSRKNKHNDSFGRHRKPKKAKQQAH